MVMSRARMWAAWSLSAALVSLVSGCGADEPQRVVHEDFGVVCARSADDGALELRVRRIGCLSSSCDQLIENECSADAEGTQIVVSSRFVVESKSGECTTDCGMATASCELPALEGGEYTFVFGQESTTVELPTERTQLFPQAEEPSDMQAADCGFLPE